MLYYDAYTREFRDGVNDPAPNAPVQDAPVQNAPVQAQPCDAPVNEYAPEAQSEPEAPAEEPEFVEKNDYNETQE